MRWAVERQLAGKPVGLLKLLNSKAAKALQPQPLGPHLAALLAGHAGPLALVKGAARRLDRPAAGPGRAARHLVATWGAWCTASARWHDGRVRCLQVGAQRVSIQSGWLASKGADKAHLSTSGASASATWNTASPVVGSSTSNFCGQAHTCQGVDGGVEGMRAARWRSAADNGLEMCSVPAGWAVHDARAHPQRSVQVTRGARTLPEAASTNLPSMNSCTRGREAKAGEWASQFRRSCAQAAAGGDAGGGSGGGSTSPRRRIFGGMVDCTERDGRLEGVPAAPLPRAQC